MTFNYAPLAADATALLAEYGGPVTQRAYTAGTYDPTTGLTTPTITDTARKGVALDFGAGQTLVGGQLVQTGDKRLLLDASATVAPQDHFVVAGTEYVIVGLGEINPAGVRVLYDIHLRT